MERAIATTLTQLAPSEEPQLAAASPVTRVGDLCKIGPHRLLCGDAKDPQSYTSVLNGAPIQLVLADAPYLVRISGVVSRRHGEFVEGSGLEEDQLIDFLTKALIAADKYIPPGCVVAMFMDSRGLYALTTSIRQVKLTELCLVAWDKTTGGMGGLYRNQVEFCKIMYKPGAPYINNVQLGRYGRNRTTLWSVPGFSGFGAERAAALERHPTSKPVSLLMDAILDVTDRGGVVLDMFAGSSSTLVAAHRTQRIGVGIELDPRFVDVSVKRLQEAIGQAAIHSETGLTFDELAIQRSSLASE